MELSTSAIIGIILFALLIIVAVYMVLTYNSLARLKIGVEEGFSTMDVYLKKRWSLLPNLVETVKGYMEHEKDLITEITEIRSSKYENLSVAQKAKADERITTDLSKIIALAENYPDLKSSTNFVQLSNQIMQIEEDIAKSRKYYNGTVRNYNNKIVTFPSGLFAKIYGFKKAPMFEASPEERQDVEIELL